MQDAAEFQWTLLPLWMSFVPYLLLYSIVSSFVFALVNKKVLHACFYSISVDIQMLSNNIINLANKLFGGL
ncbi:uncharacterized protein DC041_0000629 [Schistosoma bovis]|nr:uncharacterized protein DC041_0000629 [Schistosoma bovis]